MTQEEHDQPISAGLEIEDLGNALVSLGDNLRDLGKITAESKTWDPREEVAFDGLDYVDQLIVREQAAAKTHEKMSQTLNGLRKFRAEYEHIERLVASFAIHSLGFPQRRTATLLGVGLGTINRLAQETGNPEGD